MSDKLHFKILTQSGSLAELDADYISIPGELGEFGILPGHAPLVSSLKSGLLVCETGGDKLVFAIHWGYVQVYANNVTLLANLAESSDQIDLNRSKQAQSKAEAALKELEKSVASDDESSLRLKKYEAKLLRSLTRQSAKSF